MKKVLFAALILTLFLVTLLPVPALAAKPQPFSATGVITNIQIPTELRQAGKSDRWIVGERQLRGSLDGDGAFLMTYSGVFSLLTQAGTFHGTVVTESQVLNVDGRIEPLAWEGPPFASLATLTIVGRWNTAGGLQGEGTIDGWVTFIPTPEGHVGFITDSLLELKGKWQP